VRSMQNDLFGMAREVRVRPGRRRYSLLLVAWLGGASSAGLGAAACSSVPQVPRPSVGAPPCQTGRFEAHQTLGGAVASQPFVIIAFMNEGGACSLNGYPNLVSATGRAGQAGQTTTLPIAVVDGGDYERSDPGPHRLILSGRASASFALGTGTAYCGGSPLYMILSLGMRLPRDASHPLTVPVQTDASACAGTPIRLEVTAFVRGSRGPSTG
jgi:hypothetical protein